METLVVAAKEMHVLCQVMTLIPNTLSGGDWGKLARRQVAISLITKRLIDKKF
jgi:hypothetical protein